MDSKLNKESFDDHSGINRTLSELEVVVQNSSYEACWDVFLKLSGSEDDNFGKWRI